MRDVLQNPYTGHERDVELDIAMLDVTTDDAAKAIRRVDHTDLPEVTELNAEDKKAALKGLYKPWNYSELLSPQLIGQALAPNRPRVSTEQAKEVGVDMEALLEALTVFAITEAGIAYYPDDIKKISNPKGSLSPYLTGDSEEEVTDLWGSMSPHELFPRLWTPQEDQHSSAAEMVLLALGANMARYNERKHHFLTSDSTPKPLNSARGLAYTDPQEGNTVAPYSNVVQAAKKMAAVASELGYETEQQLWSAIEDIYSATMRDEASHKFFINAVRVSAMKHGDAVIRSYILGATADELAQTDHKGRPRFDMPAANGVKGFEKSAGIIARAGFFTPLDSSRNVAQAIRAVKPEEDHDLTPDGREAAAQLVSHLALLDTSNARHMARKKRHNN